MKTTDLPLNDNLAILAKKQVFIMDQAPAPPFSYWFALLKCVCFTSTILFSCQPPLKVGDTWLKGHPN